MNINSAFNKIRAIARESKTVYHGFRMLKKTKRTPDYSYSSMRKLFVLTNGRSNDVISRLVSKKPYDNVSLNGVLGIDSSKDLENIVRDINENGYHVFDKKLPVDMVDSIFKYAQSTPCSYLSVTPGGSAYSEDKVPFDESNIISPRYEFNQQQILECEALQSLIFDSSILSVAQSYLRTRPILDLIAMWWSAPFKGMGKSEAAQMYHFDLDRIKFIKFFFYLTDVDTNTGPHCYVRKSHKRLPPSLLKEGRLTDDEVKVGFGKDHMMELGGRRGTIMAVDTRGLHKGKDLVTGKRLLFQIEFANSMFGQYYEPGKKPHLKPEFATQFEKHKYTYQGIMS
jgi:hypothetical protein